jgi:hypothetical protein
MHVGSRGGWQQGSRRSPRVCGKQGIGTAGKRGERQGEGHGKQESVGERRSASERPGAHYHFFRAGLNF